MHWHSITIAYVAYLAVVSMAKPEFRPTRWLIAGGGAAVAVVVALAARGAPSTAVMVIVPSLVLLAGYRLSGLFFCRIDAGIEQSLLSVDRRWLVETGILRRYQRAPRFIRECLETSYVLVYAALPAGAAGLAAVGHAALLDYYWSVVLLAEFVCYGTLPWIQTRPPMLLEGADSARPSHSPGIVRSLNQFVAQHASIRANTIPSGHVAGAMAAALASFTVAPAIGTPLILLAISIALASVLGRYHYAIDAVLGILVALLVWMAA